VISGPASGQVAMRGLFVLSVLASSLTLTACEQDLPSGQVMSSNGVTSMSFSPPMQLQGKDLVRENLTLEITLNGRAEIVGPDADNKFIYQTTLPQQTPSVVSLKWIELVDGESLVLATARKDFDTGLPSTPVVLDFFSSGYDTSMDADNDGISNLEERRQGSEPQNDASPNAPLVTVPLDVKFVLPQALAIAPDSVKDLVDAIAAVNGTNLVLTRNANEWRGSTSVTKDSSPLVRVDFFATSSQLVRIATLSRSENAGGGSSVIFDAGEYETAQFNNDGDALTNIQETLIGSNAFDSSSPPDDGDGDGIPDVRDNCATISNEDQADIDSDGLGDLCDTTNALDLDGDGSDNDTDNCPAKSNEDQADVDNDGFGDICDSQNDDPDGDERNNGVDNCPDISNTDQQDSDGDNVGDACEATEEPVNDGDTDGDGVSDDDDNCPDVRNPQQEDEDEDGVGDACLVI